MGRFKWSALVIPAIVLLGTGCIRRVTVSELLPPANEPLSTDELVTRINAFGEIKTLSAQGSVYVLNYFTGVGSQADELPGANQVLRFQRPAHILMRVRVAVVGTKVVDMVSDGQQFQLALYYPTEKRQFIHGSNLADYERMAADEIKRAKDPTLSQAGGLLNMRPQHVTEAFLIRPASGEKIDYFREEVRQREADDRPGKKGRFVERPYYVIYLTERQNGSGRAELLRKYWFDRTKSGTPLVRQQTFEGSGGKLTSDILYSEWFKSGVHDVPGRVKVDRRTDGYRIELTLEPESVLINAELPDTTFVLENTEGLKDVDLDAPRKETSSRPPGTETVKLPKR
ncbi:MAG TPA: hypothetical protein VJH03_22120 [Blastocatellia bacterium]|nr:hypothetical protein [Blastocatellia bacterium]